MTSSPSRTLELVYFDAGGGHRNAANALQQVMAVQFPQWRVKLVNLQDVLQPMDFIHRLTGMKSQDVYNHILKYGLTYASNAMLRAVQRTIKLNAPRTEELLRAHWTASRPDLVVSLIPNFNAPMYRALGAVDAAVPYVTVMTDLVDCPPHFWQEKQDQYMICGTELAVRQARKMGYDPSKVFCTSGMILKPSFYARQKSDRHVGRKKLKLDPRLPTALVMFGGYGSQSSVAIVKRLNRSKLPVQCIVMCGHNDKLRQELQPLKNCHAIGFTDNVPYYMHLADFFIGKPGPGSISEALHMGLPVIIERNARTLPQERPNARWVERHKLGLVVKGFGEIARAVKHLLSDDHLSECRRHARAFDNRAVYEIPALFERIMDAHAGHTGKKESPAVSAARRR